MSILALYSATLFLSAFLIFLVEPMVAKMILPILGGAPAVWNTCVVFFQGALLAGYFYAHKTSVWMGVRRQAAIHSALLIVALWLLPIRAGAVWGAPDLRSPVAWLLARLIASAGLPLVLVFATAPLLQSWFARTKHPTASDPYFLYSASNLGSMLGLMAYPLAVEPTMSLQAQGVAWSAGYVGLVCLIWACALAMRRGGTGAAVAAPRPVTIATSPAASEPLWWLAYSLVPSSLMLSVTTHITTDVAAVPLLWVGPLALYLLSFVLVFARRPPVSHRLVTLVTPVAVLPPAIALLLGATSPYLLVVLIHLFGFFVVALMCHGELVRRRPGHQRLTAFYLWIAVGGVLGGLFNTLMAPVLFTTTLEYPVMFVAACLLRPPPRQSVETFRRGLLVAVMVAALTIAVAAVTKWFALPVQSLVTTAVVFGPALLVSAACWHRRFAFALGIAIVLFGSALYSRLYSRVEYAKRSFFGLHQVLIDREGKFRVLFDGTIIHGVEALHAPGRGEPASYFARSGPAGQVLGASSALVSRRVAVVGLGAGTLAAYAAPGDRWTFYEINPVIERIARDRRFFTFLPNARAPLEVVLGDGRLALARAAPASFDVIVVDAFSSDAIPVHLLTREAMALYTDKLAPDGFLLFHISNKYLDLAPVLRGTAGAAGLIGHKRADLDLTTAEWESGKLPSVWVYMARQSTNSGQVSGDRRWRPLSESRAIRLWTDDYSNVLAILRGI
ncbi:MAG: fused MFS/spermidine synthase [Acidobacteria bacterium]|nr:fused MFS/spermidine synthase [Acidobacteriota bacterium]